MSETQSSYRNILKATSLFGGVQVFNVIISIVRSKFIAILLGPAGMGIAGLLTSTTSFITGITSFGLGTSSVKNVSAANATGDNYKIASVVSVLRRLVWITGLLGTLITICLSSWLSQVTFGNKDYTLSFMCISVTLLLTQLNSGQLVILQGLRKLKQLAMASLAGSVVGLLVSVPLYYIWGIKGIVPAIIVNATFTVFFSWLFSFKIRIMKVKVDRKMLKTEGVDMLRMGMMLSLSSLFVLASSYILRIYISRTGGVAQVGLYTSGFTILNTYVGLVFSAMITDYYPRLAGLLDDNIKTKVAVNQQAEMAILIIAPILTIFIIYIKWMIVLLYSNKFIAINEMMQWAALGIFVQAAGWPMGLIFVARGDTKVFFWSEFCAYSYYLLLNIAGYKLLGLRGLGISFFIGNIIHFTQVLTIVKFKYNLKYENIFYKILILQSFLCLLCFIMAIKLKPPFTYCVGSVFIAISLVYSYIELDKRLNMNKLLRDIKNKF